MTRDHRRIFFLAAESAACLRLNHSHVGMCGAEETAKCFDHVKGTLHRAVNRNASFFRNGDHSIRLDIDVFLVSCSVRSLNDYVCTAQGTIGITPVSYTHLRAHETPEHLVCRLLL